MKTAGLIGGVGWPSTITYYRLMNQLVQAQVGEMHSAKTMIATLDFALLYQDMVAGQSDMAASRMADAAVNLKAAKSELIAILSNTGHFAAEEITRASGLPLVHIGTETASQVRRALPAGQRVGMLATGFALAAPFFSTAFEAVGLELLFPNEGQSKALDAIIFGELTSGKPTEAGGRSISDLCLSLARRGADCVVLGCTELGEALEWIQSPVPLFDSTEIHARAIVREMLA